MRLIDADKLKRTEGMFQYQINEVFDRLSASAYTFEDVENAPTVEAIPIEWIKKWISERNDFPTMPYNQHIWNMLEDWETENENR